MSDKDFCRTALVTLGLWMMIEEAEMRCQDPEVKLEEWGDIDTFIAATPTLATSHSWTPSLQYSICVILVKQ